jgi:hypothetical protein
LDRFDSFTLVVFSCSPGNTGAATFAFALEEAVLDRVPKHQLEVYYQTVVLTAKRRIDAEYMVRATFLSDLKLIVDSALRRWSTSDMEGALNPGAFQAENRMLRSRASDPEASSIPVSMLHNVERTASEQQVTAF